MAAIQSGRQAAEKLPAGLDPEAMVVILPDWDGSVTQAVGLKNVNQQAEIAIISQDGDIVGVFQGGDLEMAALAALPV